MKIVLGADHHGVEFKAILKKHLEELNHEVFDVGSNVEESVDYPDFAIPAAEMVARGEAERGVLICGSGVGMSMAANKVKGVRAGVCATPEAAALARQHNDLNVLALSGWKEDDGTALHIVDVFLETGFDGGRHARRVGKIMAYEKGEWQS